MTTRLDTYRQLGESGLFVSPLCLGAMSFGEEWGWGATEADSLAIVDRYVDAGGNFIDTADIYTQGTSERIVGKALSGRRDKVVLATKAALNVSTRDPNAGGTSRKHLTQALDRSLRRMGTDYVDLYWLHVHDGVTPVHETLRTVDDAVRAGKIRYVGVSNYPVRKVVEWQMLARQHGLTPIVAAQYEYNLLTRGIEVEHVPAFAEFGIGQVPWGPLAQGVLSGKYTRENRRPSDTKRADGELTQGRLTDRAFDVLDAVGAIARETGESYARVALTWLREQPTVVSPIVGCRTQAQLDDLIDSLGLSLSPDARAKLEAVSRLEAPYPFWSWPADQMDKKMRGGLTTVPWPYGSNRTSA
ncbi:aldo/keto reductase [Pendulispora albinea]|uniref:Aldo/keto reductase n=1 Tax=Pendulispora albinea TaxID=2741071 RepID=A0ABZ2M3C7_9BACT